MSVDHAINLPADLSKVPFVGVADMTRLVQGIGVERFLGDLAARIEADFRRWADFDKVARLAAHAAEGVIELMPASDGALYGFKYVNGHPGNVAHGRQTVAALGLLADMRTGYPLLLCEMTILTALRTAATSAIAARALAQPGTRTMALIGNGAQAEFQALAFKALLGVDRLRLHDIDPAATRKCVRNLAGLGFDVTVCRSVAEAVEGAAIITTATADKRRARILHDADVAPGVHLNAVGGDCPGKTELDRAILERATIVVEYAPQTRIEGEIQQLPPDAPVRELWQVLDGSAPGRVHADEVTLFDSVGFAIEDFSALCLVRERALARGLTVDLDLLANPDDPRDLFGLLRRAAVTQSLCA